MAKNATIRPQQIERARKLLQDLPEKEDRKTRPEAAELLERDFRKAKEKGYNPRELSQMLKNEGIIIPAYLIKRFFSEDENVSAPQKKETTPVKKHPTEKASLLSPIHQTRICNMNMPIFYIGINKGIVGKNKLAFTLIGYLLDNGKQALLLESDTSNLDVYNKESHSLVQSRLAESQPRKQHIHTCWHGEPRHLFHCCLMEISCCGSASGSAQGRCSRPPCYGCLRKSFLLHSASAAEFFSGYSPQKSSPKQIGTDVNSCWWQSPVSCWDDASPR